MPKKKIFRDSDSEGEEEIPEDLSSNQGWSQLLIIDNDNLMMV